MLKLKHFGSRLLMLKYFDLLIQRRLLIGLLIQMLIGLHLLMLKRFGLLILTQSGSRLLR